MQRRSLTGHTDMSKEITLPIVIEPVRGKGFDMFEYFRYNLPILRAAKKMSAKDLSIKLNLNEKRISNIEQGKGHIPNVIELSCIASYFHVEIDQLLHMKVIVSFDKQSIV